MQNDRHKWEGEAYYDAWRRGMNPDNLDTDRMYDAYYAGESPHEFVSRVQHQKVQRDMEREGERQREAEYWDSLDEQNQAEQENAE